jgi:outer membrane lipoprotein-sorting protein
MRGSLSLLLSLPLALWSVQALAAAESKAAHASLSAAQIVEKHVAARGGLQAWRDVQTLLVTGKIEAGSGDSVARSTKISKSGLGASVKQKRLEAAAGVDKSADEQQVLLPFTLEMKRPRRSRLEIQFAGSTAVQVYDGQNGWKLRPFLNRNSVDPFTDEEQKAAEQKGDLEGPLVNYAAQGSKVELEGVEAVEGHDAYRLKVTTKSGLAQHIWIDAKSFLDVKVEGQPRRMDGRMRNVWVYQRDFRPVHGLMMPFVYEAAVEGGPQTHKMIFESVTVNHSIDDSHFTKPRQAAAAAPAPGVAAPAATR